MTATAPEQAHLKSDAIGFVDALVIGLASTSPAYSLAAVIGPIAALVGIYAPGVLLASFVPSRATISPSATSKSTPKRIWTGP